MLYSKEFYYDINSQIGWDDQVYKAIKVFYTTYQKEANILQANSLTLDQFDVFIHLLLDQKKQYASVLESDNDLQQIPENERVGIVSFSSILGTLDFAVDDDLNYNVFNLIYDDEVEWVNDKSALDSSHLS